MACFYIEEDKLGCG